MPYYSHTSGAPAAASRGTSSNLRAEFDLIQAGFTSAYNDIQTLAAAIGAGTSSVESPIASATTTTIGSAGGNIISITGTNTISSFGSVYNGAKYVRFTGSLTLLASATLVTPSGANIVTQAGDSCIVVPIGNPATGWRIASYERMSQAMLSDDAVRKSTATLQTITGALTVGGAMIAASFAGPLNGSVGATTPSTGAFTTLSATGTISGPANSFLFAETASTANLQAGVSSKLRLGTTTATNVEVYSNGSNVGVFSSTGLAVTGALSATQASGGNVFSVVSTGNTPYGRVSDGTYTLNFGVDSTNPSSAASFINASNGLRVLTNGGTSTTATFSSTGLAVTGALSATGALSSSAGSTALTLSSPTNVNVAAHWSRPNKAYQLSLDINNNGGTDFTLWDTTRGGIAWQVDGSGNLGLGVTPKTWSAGKAHEVGFNGSSLYGFSQTSTYLLNNAYYNAGFKYATTNAAAYYNLGAAGHYWGAAISGTVDTAITFSQQMALDANGNLGIGVTPSAWASYKAMQLAGVNGVYGYNNDELGTFQNAYYNAGWKYAQTGVAASWFSSYRGTYVWNIAPSGTAGTAITFTQAMTLDASGNLLVGTTNASSPTGGFSVQPNSNASFINIGHVTGTTTGSVYEQFWYNSSIIGSITQNGTTAVAFNTTSDHRLKTNVRPADAKSFKDIRFVDFEWVDGRHDCGVIAHELQAIYPDLVVGTKDETETRTVEITPAVPEVLDADGNVVTPAVPAVTEQQTFDKHQQVNYIGLIPRMGTVIQQLMAQVEALEARIAVLEAK